VESIASSSHRRPSIRIPRASDPGRSARREDATDAESRGAQQAREPGGRPFLAGGECEHVEIHAHRGRVIVHTIAKDRSTITRRLRS
jgi:hypothetical protein